eukprot:4997059-Ditylum_brightwellii.AAC.1
MEGEPLFQQVPFGIWLEAPREEAPLACWPICRHKLLHLLGLRPDCARQLLQTQWHHLLPQLRVVPGRHRLSSLFAAVKRAELAASAWEELQQQDSSVGKGQVQVMLGEVNPLTTVPLPTKQEWKDASETDRDLNLVLQALQPGADPLQKTMLEDKRREKVDVEVAANEGCTSHAANGSVRGMPCLTNGRP